MYITKKKIDDLREPSRLTRPRTHRCRYCINNKCVTNRTILLASLVKTITLARRVGSRDSLILYLYLVLNGIILTMAAFIPLLIYLAMRK